MVVLTPTTNNALSLRKNLEEAESRDYSELDSLLNDLPFVTVINETQTARAQLLLSGVHCSACAWLVESVVQQLPGIEGVQVNC